MTNNPFRTKLYRKGFDNLIKAYRNKHRDLIRADGSRCKGNSIAVEFWRGFDDVNGTYAKRYTKTERNSLGWVYYRAGRAVAECEAQS